MPKVAVKKKAPKPIKDYVGLRLERNVLIFVDECAALEDRTRTNLIEKVLKDFVKKYKK